MPPPSRPDRCLVLVPTELELRLLDELGGLPPGAGAPALTGFGPVAAAARASWLLRELRPARVLLLGLAGGIAPERAPLGGAATFARVRLDGVGAGAGTDFRPASQMGFPLWQGPEGVIEETLPLEGDDAELLTVCSASASRAEAAARHARYPDAVAEDMEGFAVALACRLAGVPLVVVRGISNAAGERDKRAWQVRPAMAAARELALAWLGRAERAAER